MAELKDLQSENRVEEKIDLVGLSPGLTVDCVTSGMSLACPES